MAEDTLLRDLHNYCREIGWKHSTVCVRALNDSKFVERHQRRVERIAQDEARLRRFMAENPPPAPPAGSGDDAGDDIQAAE
jgi:hypothetical protein